MLSGNFGHNVIFIPNRDAIQTELSGDEVFRQCEEDVCGCWTASAGVVHDLWRDLLWPDNLPYDYGFWIVDDVEAHDGTKCATTDALDGAVDAMEFDVGVNLTKVFVNGFGYSLEYNPDFRVSTSVALFNLCALVEDYIDSLHAFSLTSSLTTPVLRRSSYDCTAYIWRRYLLDGQLWFDRRGFRRPLDH